MNNSLVSFFPERIKVTKIQYDWSLCGDSSLLGISPISVNCGGDRRDLLDKEIKVAVDAIIQTASLDN